jgi:hypothetical protein
MHVLICTESSSVSLLCLVRIILHASVFTSSIVYFIFLCKFCIFKLQVQMKMWFTSGALDMSVLTPAVQVLGICLAKGPMRLLVNFLTFQNSNSIVVTLQNIENNETNKIFFFIDLLL